MLFKCFHKKPPCILFFEYNFTLYISIFQYELSAIHPLKTSLQLFIQFIKYKYKDFQKIH